MAHFEAAGWRAYYERDWLRLLRLLVALCQEQFRIPFPRSLLAAYYVVRASTAWAPLDHDPNTVRDYYRRFYAMARRWSGLTFDAARVADLELAYNDVHRRLSGGPTGEKGDFVRTMVELHSAIFGLTPRQARESARLRVMANNVVDGITSNARETSPGTGAAWKATCGAATARSGTSSTPRAPNPPTGAAPPSPPCGRCAPGRPGTPRLVAPPQSKSSTNRVDAMPVRGTVRRRAPAPSAQSGGRRPRAGGESQGRSDTCAGRHRHAAGCRCSRAR